MIICEHCGEILGYMQRDRVITYFDNIELTNKFIGGKRLIKIECEVCKEKTEVLE